ncbi:hypothetical protein [Nocardioides sp. Leaf307]|nr:hypothetical protein [Nocardioides sp. Leaf307]
MSDREPEVEPDDEGGTDSGDELVGMQTLQNNDSDTIKHSQDRDSEDRED